MRDIRICQKCEHYCKVVIPDWKQEPNPEPLRRRKKCRMADPVISISEKLQGLPYHHRHIPEKCPWYPAQFVFECNYCKSLWYRAVSIVAIMIAYLFENL